MGSGASTGAPPAATPKVPSSPKSSNSSTAKAKSKAKPVWKRAKTRAPSTDLLTIREIGGFRKEPDHRILQRSLLATGGVDEHLDPELHKFHARHAPGELWFAEHARPVVVQSFGERYVGIESAPYSIVGGHDVDDYFYEVPCEYRAVVRLSEHEVALETREGIGGPEFQMICHERVFHEMGLPRKVWKELHWCPFITNVWEELLHCLDFCESFELKAIGPWELFGITHPDFQARLHGKSFPSQHPRPIHAMPKARAAPPSR